MLLARVIVMRARSNSFSIESFLRQNSYCRLMGTLLILLSALSAKAGEQSPPLPQDTSTPNVFGFTSDVYYVDEDATNAVITVEFTPGNRAWSGSVNYRTTNGTAVSGEDYTETSGALYFSGPGTPVPVINIPIFKDSLRESNETVEVYLSNPNAIITRSHATLIILDKNQNPVLKVTRAANGAILLSWPSNYEDFALEKSESMAGPNWNPVTASKGISNGSYNVMETCTGLPAFYRLKKTSTP